MGRGLVLGMAGLVMSMASYAERLPVDDAIDGLRAKATHLEKMKNLLQKNNCVASFGPHNYPLSAGALRDNAIVMGISDSIPGQYLAFSQAPKASLLKQVVSMTHRRPVNRVFIVSSSLKAAPGAEDYTHLYVALAQPVYEKDLDGTDYQKVGFNIPLAEVEKGVLSKELTVKGGGGFRVSCNKGI